MVNWFGLFSEDALIGNIVTLLDVPSDIVPAIWVPWPTLSVTSVSEFKTLYVLYCLNDNYYS